MALKPWRELAVPHDDVLKGTYQDAEFAADLSSVHEGNAPQQYQEASLFFERTYITEGMGLLLNSVLKRLSGKGGDPIIQLKTAFGGGKTHTMLAVYHLTQTDTDPKNLRGIQKILDELGVKEIPRARVVVIDGNKLPPAQPHKRGSVLVHTLWGEMAYQLGGKEAYDLIAASDKEGTSPGKELLVDLLKAHAPCVILIDELVAYMRQFEDGKQYAGGTFESNASFIQALTEAVKKVPQSIVLASLPESVIQLGGTRGQVALATLEEYFGRVHAIWKPVATEEAFEIVRRRLFEPIKDEKAVDNVCLAFHKFYVANKEFFPADTQESSYLMKLKNSYPIHPEVFKRLYDDWSTLENFQRTRGVLQLLAQIIHRLWTDDNRDPMIMPGSLPLYDINVRNKSIYFLPQGWDPVIELNIDGEQSEPTRIDANDPRFGPVLAARRVARTIFLGSAPCTKNDATRGVEKTRIFLGAVQPDHPISVFQDVLGRMRDRLHYLNVSEDRYFYDTRPNLRREMEERKNRFGSIPEFIAPELKARITKMLVRGCFGGTHVFTGAGDVPDDQELRLVVLPIEAPYAKSVASALDYADTILRTRGSAPRLNQNRLVFLAPDLESSVRVKDMTRTYLAWKSIKDDYDEMKLNLDRIQGNQAKKNMDDAGAQLNRALADCYKWALCPVQTVLPNKPPSKTEWDTVSLDTGNRSIVEELSAKLFKDELVLKVWAGIHLSALLKEWFFKDSVIEIKLADLWSKFCQYLYFPRIANTQIFIDAIKDGLAKGEYFGYADGKEGDKYLGLVIGSEARIVLDNSSLLIELETARRIKQENDKPVPGTPLPPQPLPGKGGKVAKPGTVPAATSSKLFYGTAQINAQSGMIDFKTIYDEIIKHLITKPGIRVTLKLDIEAQADKGFDDATVRTIKENATSLKFTTSEFE